MTLGLCMVVKNEAHQLDECLSPIIACFDQVEIVDTGSEDETPRLLRERFGLEVPVRPIEEHRCGCLCDARHDALARLDTDWVLTLDADERIDPPLLQRFRAQRHDPQCAGYFARWRNHLPGEAPFDDYKLFLFRNGLRPQGLVHDVVQLEIRQRGLCAQWLDNFEVVHVPDGEQQEHKLARYRARLHCALRQEPDNVRYHWFLGYTEFRAGNREAALQALSVAAQATSARYPVEGLNAATVLAQLHAEARDEAALVRTLQTARAFYQQVRDDFEVRVNVRLQPWLNGAWESFCQGHWERIRADRFAC